MVVLLAILAAVVVILAFVGAIVGALFAVERAEQWFTWMERRR